MPRLSKRPMAAKADTLEVIHHEVPDTAAGAGAAPIPARTYAEGGMTWRRMMRVAAITEAAGYAVLMVAAIAYGLGAFPPAVIALVLFAGAAVWLPRMTKASTIYMLVISSITLLFLGMMGVGGFRYITSWFEVAFAVLSVLVPIAAIVAAIATLRHREGDNAARTTGQAFAVVCAAVLLVSVVASIASSDAARLPGDATLTAKNIEYAQTSLTAKAGDVAIYFQNKDPLVHNVTIEGHGHSKDAAGRSSIRHVFKNLPAGTYKYFCSLHKEEMKGTLTVT